MKEELNTSNDEEDLTRVSDKPKEKDKTANS
jgi:hypothetical protein